MSRVLAVGAVLLALAVGAGCGDDDAGPASAETPVTAAVAATGVVITAPESGAVATLAHRDGRSTLAVRGTATPGERVRVTAGCAGAPCAATARAGADGTWTVRVSVRLDATARALTVAAEPAASTSTDPANVIVLQVTPADAQRAVPRPAAEDTAPARTTPRPERRPEPTRTVAPVPGDVPLPVPASPGGVEAVPPPAGGGPVRGTVHAIGDSLVEGIAPVLPSLLPRARVVADHRRGRPLAAGLPLLLALPRGSTVAVSLFTNDDPRRVDALADGVRRVLDHVGPGGCVAWGTFVRPPVGGVSYAGANDRLRTIAAASGGRLRVVGWAELVTRRPELLGRDGIHATPQGYRELARLYADALAGCP